MTVFHARKVAAHAAVDEAIRATLRLAGKPRRAPRRVALERLLRQVRGRSNLLCAVGYRRPGQPDAIPMILSGLLALAAHFKSWIRAPEQWVPAVVNPRPQFASLAHHLLANYPVPSFLTSAWFLGQEDDARQRQGWFIYLGRGGSVRTAGFPVLLNRTMAHCLTQAPAHLPIEHALRWAQVAGLGGGDVLAGAVAASRLGSEFANEHFWLTVLQFFVNQPRLNPGHVAPVIEYLNHQKFHCERVIIGEDTEIYLDPPQPDLSMKGRTLPALLRRIAEWQEQQEHERPVRRCFRWAASSIGGFRHEDDEGRTWTIRELLDSDELAREGKVMHHCVADYYVEPCARRETTIWSLGIEMDQGRERVLTIQVDPATRVIVQASMHCNADPDEWCRRILGRWAAQESLTIECLAEEAAVAP